MSATGRPAGTSSPIANRPWPRVRLGEVCNHVNGDAYRSEDWSRHGTPIIRIQNLNDPSKPYNYWPGSLDRRVVVRDGDVLLAWSGTPGTSFGAHHWQGGVGVLNQHIFRVDLDRSRVDPAWTVLAINEQLHHLIDRAHGGVGLRHVTRKECDNLRILVPPLPEQRRIAARLQAQLAAVEEARARVQAQLDEAKKLPAALLRDVFGNTAWPGAKRLPLGRVLNLRKDIVHPRNQPVGQTIFVGLEHIESGTGRRIGSLTVKMEDLTGRKPRFQKGDIVYGYLRPYLNKVWVAEFDGLCSVDQYVYAVDQTVADTAFLGEFMRSPVFLRRAPISTTPGQLPRIRTDEVASVPIELPLLEVQRQIARRLRDRLAEAATAIEGLTAQLLDRSAVPGALLREAFGGGV